MADVAYNYLHKEHQDLLKRVGELAEIKNEPMPIIPVFKEEERKEG